MYAISSGAIIGIGVAALVVLAVLVLVVTSRRSDVRGAGALSRETRARDKGTRGEAGALATGREVERAARQATLVKAPEQAVEEWVAPDPEQVGVSRRHFLNVSAVTLMTASLGGFGAAVLAFLWPSGTSGFGGKVPVGKLEDIIAAIKLGNGFGYYPSARAWITAYPAAGRRSITINLQGCYVNRTFSLVQQFFPLEFVRAILDDGAWVIPIAIDTRFRETRRSRSAGNEWKPSSMSGFRPSAGIRASRGIFLRFSRRDRSDRRRMQTVSANV